MNFEENQPHQRPRIEALNEQLFKPEPEEGLLHKKIGLVSLFAPPIQNVIPCATKSVFDIWKIITSDKMQTHTMILRSLATKEAARQYKSRNFPYVTFSGIFAKRSEAGFIRHSNLLTIDCDGIYNPHQLMEDFISNPYFETVMCFISPGGQGVKWIIKIDLSQGTHLQWFNAVYNYVLRNYRIEIDKSGKDISRCCFLPYDPGAYLNEKYM